MHKLFIYHSTRLYPVERTYYAFGTPPYSARAAGDGVFAMMGVTGTLGTSDVGATQPLLPIAVDPATGAQYVEILGTSASSGGGSEVIISGTNGTQTTAYPAFVDSNNALYMNMLYKLDGTNDSITVTQGSLQNVATISQVIPGTTSSTLGKSGSNQSYAAGDTGVLMLGVRNDSFQVQAGTLGQYVPLMCDSFGELFVNIGQGVVQLNPVPSQNVISWGTTVSGVGTGTLVAAGGVGTSIFVYGLSVGGDTTALGTPAITISFGTVVNGEGVLYKGAVPTTSPVVKTWTFAPGGDITNKPLTYINTTGGTMDITVQYFVSSPG